MLDAIRSEQYKTRHTKIFTILCVGALVLGVITVYMNVYGGKDKGVVRGKCTKKWYE